MAKTISELKAQSAEVKNASAIGENTATRVGQLFSDIVEHVEQYEINKDGKDASQDAQMQSLVSAEESRAKGEERGLQNQIHAEKIDRQTADTYLSNLIQQESSARETADENIRTALANETARAQAAEQELAAAQIYTAKIKDGAVTTPKIADGAVTYEKTDIIAQELGTNITKVPSQKVVTDAIQKEETERKADVNGLAAALASETIQREQADENLNAAIEAEAEARDNAINNEAQARSQNDALLNQDIVAETTRAEAREQELTVAIQQETERAMGAEEANADAIAIDSDNILKLQAEVSDLNSKAGNFYVDKSKFSKGRYNSYSLNVGDVYPSEPTITSSVWYNAKFDVFAYQTIDLSFYAQGGDTAYAILDKNNIIKKIVNGYNAQISRKDWIVEDGYLIVQIFSNNDSNLDDAVIKITGSFIGHLSELDTSIDKVKFASLNAPTNSADVNSIIQEAYTASPIHQDYLSKATRVFPMKAFLYSDGTYVNGFRIGDASSIISEYKKTYLSEEDALSDNNPEFILNSIIAIINWNADGFNKWYTAKFANSCKYIDYWPLIKSRLLEENLEFNVIRIAPSNASYLVKSIADEVCSGDSDNEIINKYSSRTNTVILLFNGTFSLSSYINICANNVSIIGVGNGTTRLVRASGYAIKTTGIINTVTIKNIVTDNDIDFIGDGATYIDLYNITYKNGIKINNLSLLGHTREINVGVGMDIENFSEAYTLAKKIITTSMHVNRSTVTINIYGFVAMERTSSFLLTNNVNIFGMTKDATINVKVSEPVNGFTIQDTELYGVVKAEFRNVRFLVTGDVDGYNFCAMLVKSNNVKFFNCTFENQTSSPVAYNPAIEEGTNNINSHGDRRHGCQLEIEEFDNKCNVELHNCKGIASPYGFKNSRGFYIYSGSPRLYGCIGIGGGIGERGYGIVMHRHSKAYLYDCIGIGSAYGWGLNNGLQFQANSSCILFHCTAIAGNGYRYISNGGVNTVRQSSLCGASHAYGFLMSATPNMLDCVGYAGDADNSSAIYAADTARPIINGGVYGKQILMKAQSFVLDDGKDYMTLNIGNDNRRVELVAIYVECWNNTAQYDNCKIQVLADDDVVAESLNPGGELTIYPIIPIISANAVVKIKVVDIETGVGKDVTSTRITVRYKVDNEMSCILLQGNSAPQINGAYFIGNASSNGVVADSNGGYRITDSIFNISNKAVISSSERSKVPIVNCKFSRVSTENIVSFIDEEKILGSSNLVI